LGNQEVQLRIIGPFFGKDSLGTFRAGLDWGGSTLGTRALLMALIVGREGFTNRPQLAERMGNL